MRRLNQFDALAGGVRPPTPLRSLPDELSAATVPL